MSKQLIAWALIQSGKDESDTFEEDFKVDSKETAEALIKETVDWFNKTLQVNEKKRTFLKIIRFENKEESPIPDYSLDDDDINDYDEYYGSEDDYFGSHY